jgi:glycosyltransferase involved in cell wall biosynthesis
MPPVEIAKPDMKIAHIVDSMEMGGAEMLVSQLCHAQRAMGHTPCVYAVAALGVLGERLQRDGFDVQANLGRHLPDATWSFLHTLRTSRPDAVHLHNPTPTIYAALAARIAGVRRIVSTRHSLVAPPHNRVAEFKYALAARCCHWIVGICDATTSNVKAMHRIPERKIVRVYNGAAPLSRVAPEQWPVKSGFTLVYVGRLEPVKNHELLFQAFRVAQSTLPDLRLWMVGDGTQRATLESLARELGIQQHVTFWGQQLDVAPFFSAADAFIMSSKSEGLPMSLLQAFSIGLPAIVTEVGGMAEVVRLARAGLTIPPADPAAMAAAITSLARNDGERRQFSKNAAEAFQAQFTIAAMAAEYFDLYERAAQVPRRA